MNFNILLDLIYSYLDVMMLSLARPLGLTITFIAFSWFKINVGIIRMGIAISLGLPVFIYAGPNLAPELELSEIPILLLFIKEIMIGAIIGWLISLPLVIASGAGAIIDTYRGAFQGSPDPTGGQVTAIGHLFMISSFGLFASIGGFWIITDLLYQSYAPWPISSPMPDISAGLEVFFIMLANLVKAAFILAAPIVTIMFISDMSFLIAAKLGKKINVTFLAFSTKSLIVVSLLPLFMFVFMKTQKKNFEQFEMVNNFLRLLLP